MWYGALNFWIILSLTIFSAFFILIGTLISFQRKNFKVMYEKILITLIFLLGFTFIITTLCILFTPYPEMLPIISLGLRFFAYEIILITISYHMIFIVIAYNLITGRKRLIKSYLNNKYYIVFEKKAM